MWNKNQIYWVFVATAWMIDHVCRERFGILYDIIACMIANSLFYYSLGDGNVLSLLNKSYLLPFGVFVHYKFYHLLSAGYYEGNVMYIAGFITALWFIYIPQIVTMGRYYVIGKNMLEEAQKNDNSPIDFLMNVLGADTNSEEPNKSRQKPKNGLLGLFSTLASSVTKSDENHTRNREVKRGDTVTTYKSKDSSFDDVRSILELMEGDEEEEEEEKEEGEEEGEEEEEEVSTD